MKRQGGFTLIELVVVIVILGILAVTAAPRFLNLQGDARSASLQGLQGAMKGAAGIVYGKSAIKGIEKSESGSISVDGKTINVVYGYPAATTSGIGEAVAGLDTDWQQISPALGTGIQYTFTNSTTTGWSASSGCYVRYDEATGTSATSAAKTSIVKDKC
ncbi:type II secretion system GspH family protein [Vibrio fluvialis]|nr:type II secretion system GspH family protein [Vibrio fluvialis]MBY7772326.1 type II secretion system GspH family protein [Vibrio fluvialis]MBY7777701.1 type II secretion system GspH family protein [Vibrio fluvialis]MBY7847313.1 type II secretion system GspH family protein [Vibrio fluvialis]MBY7868345.1 type II secretion system GspH family protein [Vibrio fluvialis]